MDKNKVANKPKDESEEEGNNYNRIINMINIIVNNIFILLITTLITYIFILIILTRRGRRRLKRY